MEENGLGEVPWVLRFQEKSGTNGVEGCEADDDVMTMRQHPCQTAPALLWAAGVREEGGSARPVAGAPTRRDPGAAGPQWRWCDLTLYT